MKHFVRFAQLAVFSLTLTSPALAGGGIEVGTLFGVSRYSISDRDGSVTFVALPATPLSGVSGIPSLYISRFLAEQLSFGSEFSFGKISDSEDDTNLTSIFLGPRVAFYPQGHAISGPYFMGQGAFVHLRVTSDSETEYAAGPGLGYQWRRGEALVLRAEVRYRRWFDGGGRNEISLLLGLGVRG